MSGHTVSIKILKREMDIQNIKLWSSVLFLATLAVSGLIMGIVSVSTPGKQGPEGPQGSQGAQGSNGTNIAIFNTSSVNMSFIGPFTDDVYTSVPVTRVGNTVSASFPNIVSACTLNTFIAGTPIDSIFDEFYAPSSTASDGVYVFRAVSNGPTSAPGLLYFSGIPKTFSFYLTWAGDPFSAGTICGFEAFTVTWMIEEFD